MGDRTITAIVSIITAVIGVAIVAVLVSNQAQTGSVITAGGTALGNVLKAATAPVSGGGLNIPGIPGG
jgi:PRD1 phage membrane DNA delivery